MINQYTELYKSLGNSDLLKIIDNPNDYQPLAVEAAKVEITARQLTIYELEIANKEYEIQQSKKQAKIEKKHALENSFNTTILSIGDTIKRPPSKNKSIAIIIIVFSLMFLVQAVSLFGLIKFMFTDDSAIWDFSMIIYLLLLLSLPIGLFLFWLRKKIGWIVLSAYITYSASYSTILFLHWTFMRHPENPLIDNLFPQTLSPLPFVFKILFFGGMLLAMCRSDIRSDYHIDRRTLFISIGFAVSLTALLFSLHLLI